MSLLSNSFKLGSISVDKNYCMTADEMKNIDASLYPAVFPIWCTTDNSLYLMYKDDNGKINIQDLGEMEWTNNPVVLYPTITAEGKLTWSLNYLSDEELKDLPETDIKGKSAYEIWKDLGNEGTEADFIAALKGENGVDGQNGADGADGQTPVIEIGENGNWFVNNVDTGVSASGAKGEQGETGASVYDVWLAEGNTGSEADFLASLKGEKGEDGTNGITPNIGANGNWFIGDMDTNVKAAGKDGVDGQDGTNGADGQNGTDGVDGKSAYDIWVEAGNTGTEADFLAFLKGADGQNGTDGTNGVDGLSAYEIWKQQEGNAEGTVTDFLDAISGTGKSVYEIWLELGNEGTEEEFLATLKGESGTNGQNGADGVDGLSAYEIWKQQEGNAEGTEADFLASLKGEKGDPGDAAQGLDITVIAPAYDSATSYNAGEYVSNNGALYVSAETTTGEFNESAWLQVTVLDMIRDLVSNKETGGDNPENPDTPPSGGGDDPTTTYETLGTLGVPTTDKVWNAEAVDYSESGSYEQYNGWDLSGATGFTTEDLKTATNVTVTATKVPVEVLNSSTEVENIPFIETTISYTNGSGETATVKVYTYDANAETTIGTMNGYLSNVTDVAVNSEGQLEFKKEVTSGGEEVVTP